MRVLLLTFLSMLLTISSISYAHVAQIRTCKIHITISPQWQGKKIRFHAIDESNNALIRLGTHTKTSQIEFACNTLSTYIFHGVYVRHWGAVFPYPTQVTTAVAGEIHLYWPTDFDAPKVPLY